MLIYLKNLENSPNSPAVQLYAADLRNTLLNRPKKQKIATVNLQIFSKAASKNIRIVNCHNILKLNEYFPIRK
jgi:hypothetical protein